MRVTRAHKIRLNPTPEQAEFFRRCAGVSRFVYNHGLAEWQRLYDDGVNPNALQLKKDFNAIKREEYPFVTEVPKDVAEGAFSNLGKAFKNFFDGLNSTLYKKVWESTRLKYPEWGMPSALSRQQ